MGRFFGFFGSLFGFSTTGASSAGEASPPGGVGGACGATVGSGAGVGGSEGGVSGAVGGGSPSIRLPHRLLFPASHELVEAHAIHLNDFVPNAGMSPYERPMRPPIPSTRTSSCSSMKLIAPSPTANAVT